MENKKEIWKDNKGASHRNYKWEFETGAMRESNGVAKGRMDMIPGCSIIRVSKRFQESCEPYGKYPEFNWQKGIPMHSYLDSAIRHLFNYIDGQDNEDHLAAACTNILMAMWTEEKLPQMQDIPSRINKIIHADNSYVCNCKECENFGNGFTQDCAKCKELMINRD